MTDKHTQSDTTDNNSTLNACVVKNKRLYVNQQAVGTCKNCSSMGSNNAVVHDTVLTGVIVFPTRESSLFLIDCCAPT